MTCVLAPPSILPVVFICPDFDVVTVSSSSFMLRVLCPSQDDPDEYSRYRFLSMRFHAAAPSLTHGPPHITRSLAFAYVSPSGPDIVTICSLQVRRRPSASVKKSVLYNVAFSSAASPLAYSSMLPSWTPPSSPPPPHRIITHSSLEPTTSCLDNAVSKELCVTSHISVAAGGQRRSYRRSLTSCRVEETDRCATTKYEVMGYHTSPRMIRLCSELLAKLLHGKHQYSGL